MEDNNEWRRGHTIIEVVIALMLIAIIVPAIANLLGSIVKRSSISYSETKEALIAASKLEAIKNIGFVGISSGVGSDNSRDGCTILWDIDKGFSEARVFVNAYCPPHNQTRGVQLKTILIPE